MNAALAFFEGDALLFVTAAIWGFAFVAQRVGMDFVGPFTFNGVRYLIGAVSLLPLFLWRRAHRTTGRGADPAAMSALVSESAPSSSRFSRGIYPPLLAGTVMFLGSSLQQVGLVSTTAGNAAFITSLYVVLVPFLAAIFGKKVHGVDWTASLVAVAGLWFITVRQGLAIAPGDAFVLACAFFWALHIIVIGRFATSYDPIALAMGQFAVSGILSLIVAIPLEKIDVAGLRAALVPLLYGGIASCGVAFTLQIFGQRKAKPSHASIIMSLEGLFGAIGGILLLGEPATSRILIGGGLMIIATMLPQIAGAIAARGAAREAGR